MSLSAFTARNWSDYGQEPDYPEVTAANFNRIETGIQSVTAEVLALEAALPTTYQPISAELTALVAASTAVGYAKRTGPQVWGIVTSIPQSDVASASGWITTALSGKAPSIHTHAQSDVTGLTAALATIPLASATTPLVNGTAAIGSLTTRYALADHVHPTDTSRLAATAQAVDSAKLGGQLPSYYAMASAIPAASSTIPAALGTATVGVGTTWARADHVHAMPTAAQVGAVPTSRQVIAGSGLSGGGALSGDVTLSMPSLLTAGSAGGGASVPVLTWDAYGRLTGVSTAAITPAGIGAATAASLANYLPLAGGTMSGTLTIGGSGLSLRGVGVGQRYLVDSAGGIYLAVCGSANAGKSVYLETYDTDVRHRKNGVDYTIWTSGNLTGDQSAHYHSSDRAWANITDVPVGVRAPWEYFQPKEDQRLRTTDSPSFSNITATGLAKVAALELSYGGSSTGTPRVTYDGMNLSFYFNDVGTIPLYIDKSTLQAVAYKLRALNVVSDLIPYTGYLNVGVPSNPWNGVFSKKICLSAEVFSSNVDAQKGINNSFFEMLPSDRVTEVAIMPDSSTDYPAGTLLVIKGRNTGTPMLTQIKDVNRNIKAKDGSILALANTLYGLVGTKMFVRTNSLEWQEI